MDFQRRKNACEISCEKSSKLRFSPFPGRSQWEGPSHVHVCTCVHRPTKELPPSPFLRRPRRHRRRGRGAPLRPRAVAPPTPVTPPPPRRKPAEESPLFLPFPPFMLCAGDYVSNSRRTPIKRCPLQQLQTIYRRSYCKKGYKFSF